MALVSFSEVLAAATLPTALCDLTGGRIPPAVARRNPAEDGDCASASEADAKGEAGVDDAAVDGVEGVDGAVDNEGKGLLIASSPLLILARLRLLALLAIA
mmetsp:Transcript_80278/g.141696  ORF Transcript_80278/g.141696 Transcript_80278/m.141696 type:complete len:101 (-) Transcript_80278:47-349(-)